MIGSAAPPRIAIRCDASETMGGGHAMRCLTLADALAATGTDVTFVAATMPDALERRITAAGHRLRRIPASPELQREGPGWEQCPLSANAQMADANATSEVVSQCDWIIIDHYLLDSTWHSATRAFAGRVLVIDDLANRLYHCDVLLDQTFGRMADEYRQLVPGGAKMLAGAQYALLRPEFVQERPAALQRRQGSDPVQRILITMGTADPGGISAQITERVLTAAPELLIDVVLGPQAGSHQAMRDLAARHHGLTIHANSKRMAELVRDADVAIGAGGMSALERCCLGLPSIIVCLADNQRANAMALEQAGAAFIAESAAETGQLIAKLCSDRDMWTSAWNAAMQITDGQGAQRVIAALDTMRKGKAG